MLLRIKCQNQAEEENQVASQNRSQTHAAARQQIPRTPARLVSSPVFIAATAAGGSTVNGRTTTTAWVFAFNINRSWSNRSGHSGRVPEYWKSTLDSMRLLHEKFCK